VRRLVVLLVLVLAACAPTMVPPGPELAQPRMAEEAFVTRDGLALPLRTWRPEGPVRAVLLGLHGLNDYSNAFALPAGRLARQGILTVAYDQRGFGGAPHAGRWAGAAAMVDDAVAMAHRLRARHPGVPLYFLGESMGGAVAMLALARDPPPPVDGAVLVGPAVWGRAHMNPLQRSVLWLLAHTIPWYPLTGQGLGVVPTDNLPLLRAMVRDPLVLKETRVDTLWGLVDLMDAALAAAPVLDDRLLLLYGLHDELIPLAPTRAVLEALPPPPPPRGRWRVAVYPDGYHMLLRDLDAATVVDDVAAWVHDPSAPLPSGADVGATARLGMHARR